MINGQKFPKVSFGILALNTEPFTKYCLRSLYPLAHQILICEGATPSAVTIAGADGHSNDGSLQAIRDFIQHEDPDKKVTLVTAEDEGHPNGFWPGEKEEMSEAYAKRATGEYLWQVDADEFYHEADMRLVLEKMQLRPNLMTASFQMLTFWGGFDCVTDGWYLRRGAEEYHRLFRWKPGYRYAAHRPPTVLDERGRDLRSQGWLRAKKTARLGVRLYHYSLVFPKQVDEKSAYYSRLPTAKRNDSQTWARENFFKLDHPYRVHNVYEYPSWLEKFRGQHPKQIELMRAGIDAGTISVALRPTEDVRKILATVGYRLGRWVLQWSDRIYRIFPLLGRRWCNWIARRQIFQ